MNPAWHDHLGYFHCYIADAIAGGRTSFTAAWRRLRGLPRFAPLWESMPYPERIAWLKFQIQNAQCMAEIKATAQSRREHDARTAAESMAGMV